MVVVVVIILIEAKAGAIIHGMDVLEMVMCLPAFMIAIERNNEMMELFAKYFL